MRKMPVPHSTHAGGSHIHTCPSSMLRGWHGACPSWKAGLEGKCTRSSKANIALYHQPTTVASNNDSMELDERHGLQDSTLVAGYMPKVRLAKKISILESNDKKRHEVEEL